MPAKLPPPHAYVPWTPRQSIWFISNAGYTFAALAGDGAPTIKGGFAKIQVIDRPRRKGFTMPVGYDPMAMDVPLRFECTVTAGQPAGAYSPADIERDIQLLEGMAGRGPKVSADGSYTAAVGDPPVVQVVSMDPQGNKSNLIPPTVQNLKWVVSAISYDDHPIRGVLGDRHRQDVVVSLSEWVSAPVSQAHKSAPYHIWRSTLSMDTVAKIVRKYGHHSDVRAYREALSLSQRHGLRVRSYNQRLKPGTAVYVPTKLT